MNNRYEHSTRGYEEQSIFSATPKPRYEKASIFSYFFGQNGLPGFIIPLLLFLGLIGVVWYSYPKAGEDVVVAVIQADPTAYRHIPTDVGGMEIEYQDKAVFEPLETNPKKTEVEQLIVVEEEPIDRAKIFKNSPVRKPDFKPMMKANSKHELNLDLKLKQTGEMVESLIAGEETVPTSSLKKRLKQPNKVVETKAVAKKNVVVAPVKTITKTADKTGWAIQLGAFSSKDLAKKAWKTESRKYPNILAGYVHDIHHIDLGNKGVFYRLRLGNFKEKSDAASFCDKLKVKGGSCLVTK